MYNTLLSQNEIENWIPTDVYGVCSDYIEFLNMNRIKSLKDIGLGKKYF